jgi:hypothetical protein
MSSDSLANVLGFELEVLLFMSESYGSVIKCLETDEVIVGGKAT